jgi:hypothetical protein
MYNSLRNNGHQTKKYHPILPLNTCAAMGPSKLSNNIIYYLNYKRHKVTYANILKHNVTGFLQNVSSIHRILLTGQITVNSSARDLLYIITPSRSLKLMCTEHCTKMTVVSVFQQFCYMRTQMYSIFHGQWIFVLYVILRLN